MYDPYRPPPPAPARPARPWHSRYWTRPRVAGAGALAGLCLGLVVGASTVPDAAPAREAVPQPAVPTVTETVEVGLSEDEVQAQVDGEVASAVDELEEQLAAQEQQAAADLEAVRRRAREDRAAAVDRAVARTLASVPDPVASEPEPQPDPDPVVVTDPIFGTCGEANDNGYGPYRRGTDPEYDSYDDRDGDGIVCET